MRKHLSKWSRRYLWTIVLIVVVLGGARAALPQSIQWYVNRTLDRIPEYDGRIGDVDVALLRGAYAIKDVNLVKTTGKMPIPFFAAKDVDFSIQWNALLEGKVVGEVAVDHGQLNFVDSKQESTSQKGISDEWLKVVKDLFPLRLNKFTVTDSEIHYRNYTSTPTVDLALSDVNIEGTNLSNTSSPSEGMTGSINASARAEGNAAVIAKCKLNPAAKKPMFNGELSIEKLAITKLNDFLRAYGDFDAEAGTIEIYAQAEAKNGRIEGAVKPLIRGLKVLKVQEKDPSVIQYIWEGMVGIFAELFENQKHEQLGTLVRFEGSYENPTTSSWDTFLHLVKNAFIQALGPGIKDNEAKADQVLSTEDG